MKKILNRIRAFFKIKGEEKMMNVESAEVKDGIVFLHPENDTQHTFCVKSDHVDICINPLKELSEDDIWVIDNEVKKKIESEKQRKAKDDKKKKSSSPTEPKLHPNGVADWPQYKKKQISFYLYEDEYDLLFKHLEENGYKKAEFFYACIQAAKKNSMEAVYKQVEENHKQRRRESRKISREHVMN